MRNLQTMSEFFENIGGDSAILVGNIEGLANSLRRKYNKLIIAEPDRALSSPPSSKLLKEGEITYVSGTDAAPERISRHVDAVILAFMLSNVDDPATVIAPWMKLLNNRGQIILIEWASKQLRKKNNGHSAHSQLLDILEEEHRYIPPTSRDLVRWLQSAGLIHARQTTESPEGLFTEQDIAFIAAEGINQLVTLGLNQSSLIRKLRETALVPSPVTIAHATYKQVAPIPTDQEPEDQAETFGVSLTKAAEGPASTLLELLANALENDAEDPAGIAQKLLMTFGAKALAGVRDPGLLHEAAGIPLDAGRKIVNMLELGQRMFDPKMQVSLEIHGPEDAYRYLAPQLSQQTREYFRGLYLNVKGTLITDEIISIGTLTASLVHPREVFGPALEGRCHSVIVAHNHPSGDPNPSPEDIHLTRELAEAGRLLGIELLDHIVIGRESYVSMKERGIL